MSAAIDTTSSLMALMQWPGFTAVSPAAHLRPLPGATRMNVCQQHVLPTAAGGAALCLAFSGSFVGSRFVSSKWHA